MKKTSFKNYFNIPNLLCYFRILLIPVYLIIYINADNTSDYYIAALIVFISGLTDLLDGKIARRFNMVTEFGKVIDPAADKLTQAALVISLTFRYPLMYAVLGIFVIKELTLLSIGYWFLRHERKMDGAQLYGKICTTLIYIAMIILVLYPEIALSTANLLMIICIAGLIYSFISYLLFYRNMYKKYKNEINNVS